jgi:SSS family solute:Na+ symporter
MLPDNATIESSADQLLPRFIVRVLPAGIAGLVVAGILSAAMDSLSSGLNSACSVINEDWINRFWPTRKGNELRQVKVISWIVGIAVIAVSFVTAYVPGNLMELCYKVINLLVTPLASLFLLAMFVRWSTTLGAWAAAAASLVVAIGIAFFEIGGLSFIWIMPASLLAGIGVGCIVSLLPVGVRASSLATAEQR